MIDRTWSLIHGTLFRDYSYTGEDGRPEVYNDRKRLCWMASVFYPLFPMYAILLYLWIGHEWALMLPMLISYVGIPVLDYWLGEDISNPPEEAVGELEDDVYYRALTWLTVPLHYLALVGSILFATWAELSLFGWFAIALTAGLAGGFAVNTAHEMGHKRHPVDQWASRFALAIPFYGHFCVEHNFGHHKHVATPEDPASAKMGESIYRFATREIPGTFKRAWQIEANRLTRRGDSLWSWRNEILQSYAISVVLQGGLVVMLGWSALAFLLIHNAFAWFQLTSANYIEHYGLLRCKGPDGRYERCQPHHSWNSNHICSNLLLFHLERHSDHHAHPQRRYQSLRDFEGVPRLPSGYFGMYLLAYIPPLWFKVMDKKLRALPHVQGDLSRINRLR
jgi:alkane 1-monooxygenase